MKEMQNCPHLVVKWGQALRRSKTSIP